MLATFLGSDMKNIISYEKKVCCLNYAFPFIIIPLDPDPRTQINADPEI